MSVSGNPREKVIKSLEKARCIKCKSTGCVNQPKNQTNFRPQRAPHVRASRRRHPPRPHVYIAEFFSSLNKTFSTFIADMKNSSVQCGGSGSCSIRKAIWMRSSRTLAAGRDRRNVSPNRLFCVSFFVNKFASFCHRTAL